MSESTNPNDRRGEPERPDASTQAAAELAKGAAQNNPRDSDGVQSQGGTVAMAMVAGAASQDGPVAQEASVSALANLGDALIGRLSAAGHGFRRDGNLMQGSPHPVPIPKQQVLEAIARASKDMGVPLDTSLRIIRIESNFRADAANPRSSAKGLSQALDGTAASEWAKLRNEFGDKIPELSQPYNPYNPYHSALVGIHYARDNMNKLNSYQNDMRKLLKGGDPQNASVYLAHFLGPAGAEGLLSRGFGELAKNALTPKVMVANPHLNGMSVGDVVRWADRRMKEADMSPLIAQANKATGETTASADGSGLSDRSTNKPNVASLKAIPQPSAKAADATKGAKLGQVAPKAGAAANALAHDLTA